MMIYSYEIYEMVITSFYLSFFHRKLLALIEGSNELKSTDDFIPYLILSRLFGVFLRSTFSSSRMNQSIYKKVKIL